MPTTTTLELHYLDVGQGDCTLIIVRKGPKGRKPDPIVRTILIDCGHSKRVHLGGNERESREMLVEALIARGVVSIDVVVITHFDLDHYNGLADLITEALKDPVKKSYFTNTCFYDQGMILRTRANGVVSHAGDNGKALPGITLYLKYLRNLQALNKALPGMGPVRKTERIFCGWPEDFKQGHPKKKFHANDDGVDLVLDSKYWFPTENPEKIKKGKYSVQFDPCFELLEKDLANAYQKKSIPELKLICVSANGWVLDKKGNPKIAKMRSGGSNSNRYSLGTLLLFEDSNAQDFACWFGGDLEKEQEDDLIDYIRKQTNKKGLSILKASHHGSQHSTSPDFLNAMKPQVVMISCGQETDSTHEDDPDSTDTDYRNVHGHPHIDVIRRLNDAIDIEKVYMTWCPENDDYLALGVPGRFDVAHIERRFFVTGHSETGESGSLYVRQRSTETSFRLQTYNGFTMLVDKNGNTYSCEEIKDWEDRSSKITLVKGGDIEYTFPKVTGKGIKRQRGTPLPGEMTEHIHKRSQLSTAKILSSLMPAAVAEDALFIDPAKVDGPLSSLLKLLPAACLSGTPIEVPDTPGMWIQVGHEWPMPGAVALTDVRINYQTLENELLQINTVLGTLRLDDNGPGLEVIGVPGVQSALEFETRSPIADDLFQQRYATGQDDPFDWLTTINHFDAKAPFQLRITLIGTEQLRASHTWTTAIKDITIDGFERTLRELDLSVAIPYELNESTSVSREASFGARGVVAVGGQDISVLLSSAGPDEVSLNIVSDTGAFPSLADVATELKFEPLKHASETLLAKFSFFKAFTVGRLFGSFGLDPLSIHAFGAGGRLSFGDTLMDVGFRYNVLRKSTAIWGILEPESTIPLNTVLGPFLNQGTGVPDSLAISQFAMMATVGTDEHDISATLQISGAWQFGTGNTSLTFEQLLLDVAVSSEEGTGFDLMGRFRLGQSTITVRATRTVDDAGSGWQFEATAQQIDLPLEQVIDDLATLFHFEPPSRVPDFTVNTIDVSFDTATHNFNILADVDFKQLGPFDKGEVRLEINLSKQKPDDPQHRLEMNLDGMLELSGTQLTLTAHHIGRPDWELGLELNKEEGQAGIDLLTVARFFRDGFQPGKGFPDDLKSSLALELETLSLHYRHGYTEAGSEPVEHPAGFHVSGVVDTGKASFGVLLAGAEQPDSEGVKHWQLLFGGFYEKAHEIPLFSGTSAIPFEVDGAWLVFNTAEEKAGQWPPLPAGFPQVVSGHELKPGLLAVMTLGLDSGHGVAGLNKLDLKGNELVLVAEITTKPVGIRLEAALEEPLAIPTGHGHDITLRDVRLVFTAPSPIDLSLAGEIDLTIDDHQAVAKSGSDELKARIDVNEMGIDASIGVDFHNDPVNLFGMKDVQLADLFAEIGIDFEPPGARFGIEGHMIIDGDKDDLCIVLEFVGPIPNPEYFAVDIQSIKLDKLLGVFAGSSAHGHKQVSDHIGGGNNEIYDVGLIWAEKPLTLPDGKTAQPGFGFHAGIRFFGLEAYVALDVHPDTGIAGYGQLAPIHIGPVSITGEAKGSFVREQWVVKDGQGSWQKISNTKSSNIPSKTQTPLDKNSLANLTRERELIRAGGPLLRFNSSGSPYLEMSVQMALFGIKVAEAEVEVNDKELHFLFFLQIPAIARFRVQGDVWSTTEPSFRFAGDFFLGIGLKFDIDLLFVVIHVNVQLGVQTSMMIGMNFPPEDKPGTRVEGFELMLTGSFHFFGKALELGTIDLRIPPEGLNDMPRWVLDHILHNHADDFRKKVKKGSGADNDDPYTKARTERAQDLLVKARAYAAFIHKDILSLRKAVRLTDEELKALTKAVNKQAETIEKTYRHADETHEDAKREIARLDNLARLAAEVTTPEKLTESSRWREAQVKRMQKEINDLQDTELKLRNGIAAIWETHEPGLRQAQRTLAWEQEQAALMKDLVASGAVDDADKALQAILSKVRAEIDALAEDPDPQTGYKGTGFARIAVAHHAFLVERARSSAARVEHTTRVAHLQAKTILDAAHNMPILATNTSKDK